MRLLEYVLLAVRNGLPMPIVKGQYSLHYGTDCLCPLSKRVLLGLKTEVPMYCVKKKNKEEERKKNGEGKKKKKKAKLEV